MNPVKRPTMTLRFENKAQKLLIKQGAKVERRSITQFITHAAAEAAKASLAMKTSPNTFEPIAARG